MALLAELLLEHGIRPKGYRDGDQKLVCPQCSHQREHRRDPCLSLTIDRHGAVWLCHHCGWKGAVSERGDTGMAREQRRRTPPVRPTRTPDPASEDALAWLAERRISEKTARRNKIGFAPGIWFPKLGRKADAITFPYFRDGELVNIKFRALVDKAFAQGKDAEKIFFGLDDIADAKTVIIVEGELDKLALEEAGFVSVPDGAPSRVKDGEAEVDDAKFCYIRNCADHLDRLERIIIAVDDDEPGRAWPKSWLGVWVESAAGRRAGQPLVMLHAKTQTRHC
jgi:twinkle protein